MNIPYWVLRLLPMWDYICPRCRREVPKNSHKCPYCGEHYGFPLKVPPRCLKDNKALEEYVHKHVFPKVSAWQREYLAQYFTTIFSSGWENSGGTDVTDGGAWTSYYQGTGNTLQVSSVDKHHGNYSLRAVNGGTDENWVRKDVGSQSTLYTRFYIKVTNLGLSTVVLYHAADVGYFTCVWITSSGNLRLRYYDGGSTYTVTSSTTLSTNTWYCLEFKAVKSTTAGEYRVYLDGSEVTDLTQTNKNNGSGGIDFIRVGSACGYQSSNSLAVYIDCVVVADTYIGPEVAGQEYSFTLTETVKPSASLNVWQEHAYTFSQTIIQTSSLQYGAEATQILTETVTPTETILYWQEQSVVFKHSTTLTTILTYAAELAEVFIVNIETVNPQGNMYYWIEELITPLDWSMIALGMAVIAFVVAAAAFALK